MSRNYRLSEPARAADGIDRERRDLVNAVALLLTASLAAPAMRSALAAAPDGPSKTTPPWGDPATLVSAIGAGTLAVASVAETAEAYCKGFGYSEHWRGRIPKEMAEFWGVPAMAGRNAAVVGPPDFKRGMVRIVELGSDFRQVAYHDTLGWVALEIHVRSPKEVVTQLKGLPFVHTGGPGQANAPDGAPLYSAAQFTGPSGEPLYMTQHTQLDQLTSVGRNNVGPLFIQTLAAHPYQETRNFYLQTLGMKMRMEIDTPRTKLLETLGLPKGGSYKMAAVRAPEYCSIQIDEYPKSTPQRPATAGCFAAGVGMCTLLTRNLDAVKAALTKADMKFVEIKANSCPPFNGSRAIFCLGQSGERIEVVQT
ncbi:MAG: VOC family protein [Pseudomonadota bacterium]